VQRRRGREIALLGRRGQLVDVVPLDALFAQFFQLLGGQGLVLWRERLPIGLGVGSVTSDARGLRLAFRSGLGFRWLLWSSRNRPVLQSVEQLFDGLDLAQVDDHFAKLT
jgi:hypothetical protein